MASVKGQGLAAESENSPSHTNPEQGDTINYDGNREHTPNTFAVEVDLERIWKNAIEAGDIRKVRALLGQTNDIDFRFDYTHRINAAIDDTTTGLTPLLLSAALGKVQIVEELIRKGADISARTTNSNSTALHFSTSGGHVETAEALLKADSRSEFINAKNNQEETALIMAITQGHTEMTETLLQWHPDLSLTDSMHRTAIHHASIVLKPDILQSLLHYNTSIPIIEIQDVRGKTALHYASTGAELNCVKLLLETKASTNIKDEDGCTPVHLAAFFESIPVVNEFRRPEVAYDWNTVNHEGKTALHVAAEEAALPIVEALVSDGKTDITIRDKQNTTVLAVIADSLTFLTPEPEAWYSVILQIIKSKFYFPENPEEDSAILATELESIRMEPILESFLDNVMSQPISDAERTDLEAIMHWAVLNGHPNLMRSCIEKGQEVKSFRRGQATWLHVAAVKGHREIIEELVRIGIDCKSQGKGGITPLHMASKFGHLEAVRGLLSELLHEVMFGVYIAREMDSDRESAKRIEYIQTVLMKSESGQTALSIAIQGKSIDHRRIEAFFWKLLDICSRQISNFLDSQPDEPDEEVSHLLEMVARSERRGQKDFLIYLLKSRKGPEDEKTEDWTTLTWAIFHGFPVVVWWLLTNGSHLSGEEKSLGMRIALKRKAQVKTERAKYYDLIIKLLHNPPPILENEALLDGDNQPEMLNLDFDKLEGTIVDFYKKGHDVDIQVKQSLVNGILYDPQSVMSTVAEQDIRQLDGLKQAMGGHSSTKAVLGEIISSKEAAVDNLARHLAKRYLQNEAATKLNNDTSEIPSASFQFRWLHIPSNNMDCIQELMTKIALDANRKVREHRPLANFVRRSWAELGAGGGKKYMKPQCVHLSISPETNYDSGSKSDPEVNNQIKNNIVVRDDSEFKEPIVTAKTTGLALYIPYLSWGDIPTEKVIRKPTTSGCQSQQEPKEDENRNSSDLLGTFFSQLSISSSDLTAQHTNILHEPMTLDQYYYKSLEDTTKRDNSQVVSRYFERERNRKTNSSTDLSEHEEGGYDDQTNRLTHSNKAVSESNALEENTYSQILTVNQLWLWIIDKDTIITSTTDQAKQHEDAVVQRILDYLIDGSNKGISRPTSVDSMMSVAISQVTEFFRENKTKTGNNKRKSALEMFQESIRNVADTEATLFEAFEEYLKSEQEGREDSMPTKQDLPGKSQYTKNPYYDITGEIELLQEIKDIRDELNILKNLHEDQELVWKQVFSAPHVNQAIREASRIHSPTELISDIKEMITEATEIQNSINTLLDLKQKQANIAEAKDARKQSDQTQRQSYTIMAFTMVTILFTPMTFLTSLFALNVSDFPHKSDTLMYEGQWIFPIIFGVSAVISAVFISFAFNAGWIVDIFKQYRIKKKLNRVTVSKPPKPTTTEHVEVHRRSVRQKLYGGVSRRSALDPDVESSAMGCKDSQSTSEDASKTLSGGDRK